MLPITESKIFENMLNNENYNITKNHDIGWKDKYLNSAEVSILGNVCGSSVYPQLYDWMDIRYIMILLHYSNYFFGTKGGNLL